MPEAQKSVLPTPRARKKKEPKNKDVLDFIDWVKNRINDHSKKNYGLYMKLYKQVGKSGLLQGVTAALKKKDLEQKLPYFLGVVYREQKEKQEEKTKRARILLEEQSAQANRKKYEKMMSKLKKKVTPKYKRRARSMTKMLEEVAKQERKMHSS